MRGRCSERGQAAVEFALGMLVLLAIASILFQALHFELDIHNQLNEGRFRAFRTAHQNQDTTEDAYFKEDIEFKRLGDLEWTVPTKTWFGLETTRKARIRVPFQAGVDRDIRYGPVTYEMSRGTKLYEPILMADGGIPIFEIKAGLLLFAHHIEAICCGSASFGGKGKKGKKPEDGGSRTDRKKKNDERDQKSEKERQGELEEGAKMEIDFGEGSFLSVGNLLVLPGRDLPIPYWGYVAPEDFFDILGEAKSRPGAAIEWLMTMLIDGIISGVTDALADPEPETPVWMDVKCTAQAILTLGLGECEPPLAIDDVLKMLGIDREKVVKDMVKQMLGSSLDDMKNMDWKSVDAFSEPSFSDPPAGVLNDVYSRDPEEGLDLGDLEKKTDKYNEDSIKKCMDAGNSREDCGG